MAAAKRKGVEAARRELPGLLAQAEQGRSTIVTRHGRAIAAIVPVGRAAGARQKSLVALALVDSAPIIYVLEAHARFARRFQPLFERQAAGEIAFSVTTVTIAEVLT